MNSWSKLVGASVVLALSSACGSLIDPQASPYDDCTPGVTAPCFGAEAEKEGVGVCRGGTRTCGEDGVLGACIGEVLPGPEACDAAFLDEDCDGDVTAACACAPGAVQGCYSGPPGTQDEGLCHGGTQTCTASGAWGDCVGEALPAPEEVCDGDLLDEDCDGQFSEMDSANFGCVCSKGDQQPCYAGPAGTEGVGLCTGGTTTCDNWGLGFGSCEGEIVPIAEICDGTLTDEDCDGDVNENGDGCFCVPDEVVACDYTGPVGTENVGACKAGDAACASTGLAFAACQGEVTPSCEDCVGDENCDGIASCTGAYRWANRFGALDNDLGLDVAVDGQGNIYAVGEHQGVMDFGMGPMLAPGTGNAFIAKFDAKHDVAWALSLDDIDNQRATSVAVDGAGNVYVAGRYEGTVTFGQCVLTGTQGAYDTFLVKLDPDGDLLWARSFGDNVPAANAPSPRLALDGAGHVWLSTGVATAMYFGGFLGEGGASCLSAAAQATPIRDMPGDSYLNHAIAAFDEDGKSLCRTGFGVPQQEEEQVLGLSADAAGDNVFVSGYIGAALSFYPDAAPALGGTALAQATHSGAGHDAFVAKLDAGPANGDPEVCNVVWVKRFGDSSGAQEARSVASAGSGVVVAGSYSSAMDFGNKSLNLPAGSGSDVFVARLDADGQGVWATSLGGGADSNNQVGLDVAVDCAGNAVVTGWTGGAITGADPVLHPAGLDTDVFVLKLDASGVIVGKPRIYGSTKDQTANAIAVGPWGDIVITGTFYGYLDIGGQIDLVGADSSDVFVAHFAP